MFTKHEKCYACGKIGHKKDMVEGNHGGWYYIHKECLEKRGYILVETYNDEKVYIEMPRRDYVKKKYYNEVCHDNRMLRQEIAQLKLEIAKKKRKK